MRISDWSSYLCSSDLRVGRMDARLDDVQRKQAFDVARSDAAFVGHQCRERPTELGRQRRITTQLDIEEDRAVLTQTVGEALANPIGHALGRSARERSRARPLPSVVGDADRLLQRGDRKSAV